MNETFLVPYALIGLVIWLFQFLPDYKKAEMRRIYGCGQYDDMRNESETFRYWCALLIPFLGLWPLIVAWFLTCCIYEQLMPKRKTKS